MLQKEFISLVLKYNDDYQLAHRLWNEIETAYTSDGRHFHNLSHLEQIFTCLASFQLQAEDWDSLLFAVYYHDVIYDITRYMTENDNQDKSAKTAEDALRLINYPEEKIRRITRHILATKHHELIGDQDTNFLTDADLSILGQPWNMYEAYMKNIRKEYVIYPDSIYHAGRKKVLKSFLQMERLFKTDYFFDLYESSANNNISRELEILSLT